MSKISPSCECSRFEFIYPRPITNAVAPGEMLTLEDVAFAVCSTEKMTFILHSWRYSLDTGLASCIGSPLSRASYVVKIAMDFMFLFFKRLLCRLFFRQSRDSGRVVQSEHSGVAISALF